MKACSADASAKVGMRLEVLVVSFVVGAVQFLDAMFGELCLEMFMGDGLVD